jgi:hypothetical protein
MAINSGIVKNAVKTDTSKIFEDLTVGEAPLPQGDGSIRISPFDDYFLFTLYDEKDGQNVPIDLSNVGTVFISFIGTTDEVKIPNYTNVNEINMAGGQVLFRISAENGKRILGLNTNNFYISTKMIGESGTTSDESAIYTGTFSSISAAAQRSLTSQLEAVKSSLNVQIATLSSSNSLSNATIKAQAQRIDELTVAVNALGLSNAELTNEIAELTKDLSTAQQNEIKTRAETAQAIAEATKAQTAQTQTVATQTTTGDPTKDTRVIRTLANANQRYMFGGNPALVNWLTRINGQPKKF